MLTMKMFSRTAGIALLGAAAFAPNAANAQVMMPVPPQSQPVVLKGATIHTVTNQAAKAIAIDDRVGSLEPGKDADFVIWNGNPLSQFTKAEQTWVDGRRYFSLEEDAALRADIARQRSQLIQAVLAASRSDNTDQSTDRPARTPGRGGR